MSQDERFVVSYSQNKWGSSTEILIDRETGVNYLFNRQGYSGGLTPLLNSDGKPIITPMK